MERFYLLILFVLFPTILGATSHIVVSILPQKTFVKKIAGERAEVTVMVPPGSSPHSYEPKASQMIAISKADIYFSIDIEFEAAWLEKFKFQNRDLQFIDMGKNIKKIQMIDHYDEDDPYGNHEDELDPHIWTSPENVEMMAQTIYDALVAQDPQSELFFKKNLDQFLVEIKQTDKKIREILKDLKPNQAFLVFHPSWGYFAKIYGLRQLAVEVGGKNPKPKELIAIIKQAKRENVKVIFAQPEFSQKSARIIAKEGKLTLRKLSPLSENWSENLIQMAYASAK